MDSAVVYFKVSALSWWDSGDTQDVSVVWQRTEPKIT
jgi:hypothetical protein